MLLFSAKWWVDLQHLSCRVAAWYTSLIHMMVLLHYNIATVLCALLYVPHTFFFLFFSLFPSKNNFSPNLVLYKHLSASFTKAHQINVVRCHASDVICEARERRQGVAVRAGWWRVWKLQWECMGDAFGIVLMHFQDWEGSGFLCLCPRDHS